MSTPDDEDTAVYTFDEVGRMHRNGEPVPKGFRRPRSTPPTNPDGSKATRKDTEAFARRLIGLTRAEAEELSRSVPHLQVQFLPAGWPVTADWSPFRIRAAVDDGIVTHTSAG